MNTEVLLDSTTPNVQWDFCVEVPNDENFSGFFLRFVSFPKPFYFSYLVMTKTCICFTVNSFMVFVGPWTIWPFLEPFSYFLTPENIFFFQNPPSYLIPVSFIHKPLLPPSSIRIVEIYVMLYKTVLRIWSFNTGVCMKLFIPDRYVPPSTDI